MNDLRQAAEMALQYFENAYGLENEEVAIKEALRQALAEDAFTPCKTDPDAPHGFDRNASHNADRYVCECEGWEPPYEWVGLTNEEIQAERYKLDPTAGWTYDHFAKAIENKLKEKNNA